MQIKSRHRVDFSPQMAALWACLALGVCISSAESAEPQGLGDPGAPSRLLVHASRAVNEPVALTGRNARVQLVATVEYDSGQLRDWTRDVKFTIDPPTVARVDDSGLLVPLLDGEAILRATAGRLSVDVPVAVTSFAEPPLVNFPNEIVPVFTKLGCNSGSCHGKAGGKNGFSLSLLGFEPADDFGYLVKEGRGRRLFPAAPDRSLLLQKACGSLPHGGGVRMPVDSDEYRLVRLWVKQGMPYGSDDDPVLAGVRVHPSYVELPSDGRQQLKVIAQYSDGSHRDVTRQAQFTPNNKDLADVDDRGLVSMLGKPGDVAVMVRYQGQVDAFRAMAPLGAEIPQLPAERNFIDRFVHKKLQTLGLPPSAVCDDQTFLRRVTIDIAGRIPTLAETEEFLSSSDPEKRGKLIDRLLNSNEYADYFAQKWSAILRNKVQQNVSRSGNLRFHDWVRTSLHRNIGYDEFVRSVVTASGETRTNPAVNWHRTVLTVNEKVEDTVQVFLGLRIQCARCHHHPFEKWSQADYWGMAAFFTNVKDKNGERIYAARGIARAQHPKTKQMVVATYLNGTPLELTPDDDARHHLVDWMVRKDNPFFARSLVNRYWKHFFGSGIVDPEDDMRATNPPTNPELLDALAQHFVESNFDLKQLVRTICNSSSYQLSSIPNEFNRDDLQNYSKFTLRRLNAEVLLDSLNGFLGVSSQFNGLPAGTRAVQIPDHGSVNDSFLNAFGRPAGSSACECERTGNVSIVQSLQLLNSNDLYNKLAASRARSLAGDGDRTDAEKIGELYLRAYSRRPQPKELEAFRQHLEKFPDNVKHEGYEDVLWAMINTKEFLFNH